MDWQVIFTSVITSLVSSSVIVAGIIYIFKRSFDRALDLHYEKILEESRLRAQENTRRDAAIYDKQVDVLKEVLSLTYRLRNATRDLSQQASKEDQENEHEIRNATKKLETYYSALDELVMEERALLPPLLFKMAHELKNRIAALTLQIERLRHEKRTMEGDKQKEIYELVTHHLEPIDDLYQMIANAVQVQIGVVKEKGGK